MVFSSLTILGARSVATRPAIQNLPIAAESIRLFALPNAFVAAFFGVLSLGFTEALYSTHLGIALCAGMGIYFALRGWAYARSREMRAAGSYIGTYIAFAIAGCYGVAAIWGSVI